MRSPETCERIAVAPSQNVPARNGCGGGTGEIAPPRRYALSICRLEADVGSEGYPPVVKRAVIEVDFVPGLQAESERSEFDCELAWVTVMERKLGRIWFS
jgi:hypothetical protein